MKRILLVAALAGCAQYAPLIDGSVNPTDLQECQSLASKRINAEHFALAGAVFTGLLSVVFAPHGLRDEAFALGAVVGALGGTGEGLGTQRDIVRRCMAQRGYRVLN